MIRAAYPGVTLHNAHDDLSRGLIKDALLNIRLGNFAIRAPILAGGRVYPSCKNADNVLLLLADLSQGLIEFGGVSDFDNSCHLFNSLYIN